MSGYLGITEDSAWVPPGWIWRAVLRTVTPQIPEDIAPELVKALRDGLEPQMISLKALSSPELRIFFQALKSDYVKREKEGGKEFENRDFYRLFLSAYRSLIGLLGEDDRIGECVFPHDARQDAPTVAKKGPELEAQQ